MDYQKMCNELRELREKIMAATPNERTQLILEAQALDKKLKAIDAAIGFRSTSGCNYLR